MIIGSMVFVLVAAGLLVVGLNQGDELYYYLSIVASALAALSLIVGVRLIAAGRAEDDSFDAPIGVRDIGPAVGRAPAPSAFAVAPAQADRRGPRRRAANRRRDDDQRSAGSATALAVTVSADPPDEPPVEFATPIEASRVATLSTPVVVVDGRPRYHLADCARLAGREPEALPVKEAVELGFTPCRACSPVATLLSAGLID